mmetsp:Transcript_25966/g.53109  ORF Transcript_25966/g.53109 Transcript_25966/m.53109 type:complete len:270 (-) Transcript_25966:373-1182(-)
MPEQQKAQIPQFPQRQGPFVQQVHDPVVKSHFPAPVQGQRVIQPSVPGVNLVRLLCEVVQDLDAELQLFVKVVVVLHHFLRVRAEPNYDPDRQALQRPKCVHEVPLIKFIAIPSLIGRQSIRSQDDDDLLTPANQFGGQFGDVLTDLTDVTGEGGDARGGGAAHDVHGDLEVLLDVCSSLVGDSKLRGSHVHGNVVEHPENRRSVQQRRQPRVVHHCLRQLLPPRALYKFQIVLLARFHDPMPVRRGHRSAVVHDPNPQGEGIDALGKR